MSRMLLARIYVYGVPVALVAMFVFAAFVIRDFRLNVYWGLAAWVLTLSSGVCELTLTEEIATAYRMSPGAIGRIVRLFQNPQRISAQGVARAGKVQIATSFLWLVWIVAALLTSHS